MNKRLLSVPVAAVAMLLAGASSCTKNNTLKGQASLQTTARSVTAGDTILNVNYESGTLNSGITGLPGSDASAPDAAYMVSPGASGNYAIAHKVVYGDSAYYSDGNWRSETTARFLTYTHFTPGQERRYEFSVLLKDWPAWTSAETATRSNIFQCRVSSSSAYVPVMIRLQRNSIQIRRADASTATLVTNYMDYANQWMHFRIDVKWTMDNTGYIKTYNKLPGQSVYTQSSSIENIRTFTGDTAVNGGGKFGYAKWGVYGVPENITGIAYHDDIRIIALN